MGSRSSDPTSAELTSSGLIRLLAKRESRPSLGDLRIGALGERPGYHLAVVEAEQRDVLNVWIRRRPLVEPWRQQVKAMAAGERDQLTSVHHGSQAFEDHHITRAEPRRLAPQSPSPRQHDRCRATLSTARCAASKAWANGSGQGRTPNASTSESNPVSWR